MIITRDNYESFFMDYLEGNLEENLIDQFLDFLKQNPDLKEELHLFEEVSLPVEYIVVQEKKSPDAYFFLNPRFDAVFLMKIFLSRARSSI